MIFIWVLSHSIPSDHSCNKYCDLIGQGEVTICDSHLHDSDSHLQLHSLMHEAKPGCILGYNNTAKIMTVQWTQYSCSLLKTEVEFTA